PWMPCSPRGLSDTVRCADRGDDGRSRALRRRVTLIYGGYRGRPRQSTHDSASSGGRAVWRRELGRTSVSHWLVADPRNRASDHPPSARSVTEPHHHTFTIGSCRARVTASPIPGPVGVPPTGNPRARARSRRRSSVSAYVRRPTSGSADTDGAAPCRRSQSRAPAAPCAAVSGLRRRSDDVDSATPFPPTAGGPARSPY